MFARISACLSPYPGDEIVCARTPGSETFAFKHEHITLATALPAEFAVYVRQIYYKTKEGMHPRQSQF